MDIAIYLEKIEELAFRCINEKVGAQELIESLIKENKDDILQLIHSRGLVLVQEEINEARALLEFELFSFLPEADRIACITMCIDLQGAIARLSIIRRCEKYSLDQEIFKQVPDLFNHIRQRDNGQPDKELIDIRALRSTVNPQSFSYKNTYLVTDGYIQPKLINWLRESFASSPLFVRVYPHVSYERVPPLRLEEAIVLPANPNWWKNLTIHNGIKEGTGYLLEDCSPSKECAQQYWEYRFRGIRKLETIASRDNKGHLSMMLEEINVRDINNGFIIGRCIHLDTNDPVGTPFDESILNHLDLAINVYSEATINVRLQETLAKGKIVDASYRTHLLRIENIPFASLFLFAQTFFLSTVLVREWLEDQFQLTIS